MSYPTFANPRARRTILASVAVAALAAGGAFAEGALTSSHSAHAAAVMTSDLNAQGAPSFATLIERVKPAVVSVKVKIANASSEDNGVQMDNLPPEIQQFLKRFGGGMNGGMQQKSQPMIGEGSGFFVSADGYIVTNNHVVQNAKTVSVTMDNGKTLDAKVVGADPKTDVAVIKVNEPGDYPYVTFAKEMPRIGDWVVAIGNPYGLGGTVTAGIVSAEGRDIGDGPYDRFLQIDAPINRGNSGGPTFNMQGQVVGMNTAIYSPSGGSVGIGFAIPASTVSTVEAALEHGGSIARGYLGVEIQPVSQDLAENLGLKSAAGAIVDKVMPGTPAAEAGLKTGDVITKLNGKDIAEASDLTLQVGMLKPGEKVQLTFMRDGVEKTADATLAPQKAEKTASADESGTNDKAAPALGIQLAPAGEVAGSGDKGVAIVGVNPDGPAAEQGLATGQVILDVGGKPVSTPQDVKSEVASARSQGKKSVLMRIQTADGDRFVAVPFPKA
ncbi:MAG: Do family serine endopeptidase [Roseiarcus sp.]|uniref:Do family serine endopeptidase n=1 Tax=Roseiarcus sp. TaxID=1969460 RepID=UPI003C552993